MIAAALLIAGSSVIRTASAAFYAPNHFLGTCLTEEWVRGMETELGVSASARDPTTNQLLHPFLHAALPSPRYSVVDSRFDAAYSPSCIPTGEQIYGPDAAVDPGTGQVTDIGHVAGSIVMELNAGAVHRLNTMLFSIVTAELIGYNVSMYAVADSADIGKRITFTDPHAWCTPVHVNVAVTARSAFSQTSWLGMGELGSRNIQGIYAPTDFIAHGRNASEHDPPFYADFWRDYVTNDGLIAELAESNLRNNAHFFPPNTTYCRDGEFGCVEHCQRTRACTERERQAGHSECLVIVATHPKSMRNYWPSMLNNLDFPAYTCFVGRELLQDFVLDMQAQGKGVLFYMNYPDEFLARYPGRFERVSMPKGTAADQAKDTRTVYEDGFGTEARNPVRFDRFDDTNQKLMSFNFLSDVALGPAVSVFSRFRVMDATIEDVLDRYTKLTNGSAAAAATGPASLDPHFDAACGWMRDNYPTWAGWMLNPLPLCSVGEHMTPMFAGCGNDSSVREVSFKWTLPDPTNNSNPYVCDGGAMRVPPPMLSSRSCAWLEAHPEKWLPWVEARPACDASFYAYVVNGCGASSERSVEFFWLLPSPENASRSLECVGELPETVRIECDYMPVLSRAFVATAVLVWVLLAAVLVSMLLVFRYRNLPIIRRSQFEFLETMLVGALCVCWAILMYAGQPTDALCAVRPAILSVGFTLVFGSLVIKTLRVYRIFNTKRMKRVVLPTATMFKLLAAFLLIDGGILTTWFVVDFPSATQVFTKVSSKVETPSEMDIIVRTTVCASSNFIYSALLLFWKAVLLGTGLYLSFLVRKVSTDFQESVYIFSASVVVGLACLLLLPLAYLVPLAATTFYLFFAVVLWVSTLSVVALMLAPKVARYRDATSVRSTGGSPSEESMMNSSYSRRSEAGAPTPLEQPAKPPAPHTAMRGARVAPAAKSDKERAKDTSAPLASLLPAAPSASSLTRQ